MKGGEGMKPLNDKFEETTTLTAKEEDYKENNPIKSGVGRNINNAPEDVRTVQQLLKLPVTGIADETLFSAIEEHQRKCGLKIDGKIAPKGETWTSLLLGRKATPQEIDMLDVPAQVEVHNQAITTAANTLGIDAIKLKTIIGVESSGNAEANKDKDKAAFKGLMQMNETSWKEGVDWLKKNKGIDYSSIPFTVGVYDPNIAILVGGATFLKKGEYLKNAKIDQTHPEWESMVLMAYNAGQGTILEAIILAGNNTDIAIFTQKDYLRTAIESEIFVKGKITYNDEMLDAKYLEIVNYVRKAEAYETVANLENSSTPPKPLGPSPSLFGSTEPPKFNNTIPKNKPLVVENKPPVVEIVSDKIIYAIQIHAGSAPVTAEKLKEFKALAADKDIQLNLYSSTYNNHYCYWLTGNNWFQINSILSTMKERIKLKFGSDKLALPAKRPYAGAFIIATQNGKRIDMPKE